MSWHSNALTKEILQLITNVATYDITNNVIIGENGGTINNV